MFAQTDTQFEGALAHNRNLEDMKIISQKVEKDEKNIRSRQIFLSQSALKCIVSYLQFPDIFILFQVCKKIGTFFKEFEFFWAERCIREYTSPLTMFKIANLVGEQQTLSQNNTIIPSSQRITSVSESFEPSLFSTDMQQELLEDLGLKENPKLFAQFSQYSNVTNHSGENSLDTSQIEKIVAKLQPIKQEWFKEMLGKAKVIDKDWILSGLGMEQCPRYKTIYEQMYMTMRISDPGDSVDHPTLFKPEQMLKMSRFIKSQLKNPNLPQPTLERQNGLVKTKTIFQDILMDFVFDEQDKYDEIQNRLQNGYNADEAEIDPLGSGKFQFLEALVNNNSVLESLKQEIINNKSETQDLFDIRWFERDHYNRPNLKRRSFFHMLGSRVSQAKTMFSSSTSAAAAAADEIMFSSVESTNLFGSRISESEGKNISLNNFLENKQSNQLFESINLPNQPYHQNPLFKAFQPNSERMDSGNPFESTILRLVHLIHKNVSVHCQFVRTLLQNQVKGSDLMRQYAKRWDAFCAAAIQIHKDLFIISALINIIYQDIFPDYPCFPKFSLFRLCISVWRKQVFDQLQEYLMAQTMQYIDRQRSKLKKYAKLMKTQLKQQQRINPIPSSSSVGNRPVRSNSQKKYIKNYLNFEKQQLIYRIICSFLDLSLNQLNIHYLSHTQINLDNTPYSKFQKQLEKKTKDINKTWAENFHTSILLEIIELDLKNLGQIITEQNLIQLSKQSMKRFKRALHNRLKKKFQEFQRVKPQVQQLQINWTIDSDEGKVILEAIGKDIDIGRVNKYIRYLHSDGGAVANEITKFVKIQENNQEKRQIIEYQCKKLEKRTEKEKGIELNISETQMNLYSFCNDVTPQYVKKITTSYKSTLLQVIDNGYPSSEDDDSNLAQSLPSTVYSELPSPPSTYIPPPESPLNQDFSRILDSAPFPPMSTLAAPPPPLPPPMKNLIQSQTLAPKREKLLEASSYQNPMLQSTFNFMKLQNEQKKEQENYLAGCKDYQFLQSMPECSNIQFALPLDQVEIKQKNEKNSKIPTNFSKYEQQPTLLFKTSSVADEHSPQQDEEVYYL